MVREGIVWRQKNTKHQHSNGIYCSVCYWREEYHIAHICYAQREWVSARTHRFRTPKKSVLHIMDEQHSNIKCSVRECEEMDENIVDVHFNGCTRCKSCSFPWMRNGEEHTHTPHRFLASNFLRSVIFHSNYKIHSQLASKQAIAMNHRMKILCKIVLIQMVSKGDEGWIYTIFKLVSL